jgi:hypothetical protein
MKKPTSKPQPKQRPIELSKRALADVTGGGDAPSNVVTDYSPDSDRVVH